MCFGHLWLDLCFLWECWNDFWQAFCLNFWYNPRSLAWGCNHWNYIAIHVMILFFILYKLRPFFQRHSLIVSGAWILISCVIMLKPVSRVTTVMCSYINIWMIVIKYFQKLNSFDMYSLCRVCRIIHCLTNIILKPMLRYIPQNLMSICAEVSEFGSLVSHIKASVSRKFTPNGKCGC